MTPLSVTLWPHTDPMNELRAQMAVSLAKQTDDAVIGALHRRGLTLDEARPRMTREVLGGIERYLLDGEAFVEIGPRRFVGRRRGHDCHPLQPPGAGRRARPASRTPRAFWAPR